MAIKAVLGFVISLFSISVFGGIALAVINSQRGRKPRPGVIIAIIGVLGVAIVAPLNAGLVLIEPNEVGVVFRQTSSGNDALLEPLSSGLSWVVPFIDQVDIYSSAQQSVTMAGSTENYSNQGPEGAFSAVRTMSSDGQVIFVDVNVIYRLDVTKINDIHRSWRKTFEDGFIVPQVRSEVRNIVSLYGAEEVYSGGRAQMETQIASELTTKLAREGIILTDVLIRNIEFSQEFTDAIERKQIAEQEAQRAVFLVQQAEQAAEQVRVEAKGRADAAVIEATGEGESIIIRAEAEAEALQLINSVLSENPNLLQWQYINELGDNVRLILLPSNSPFLFDLESLLQEAGAEPVTGPLPTPAPEGDTP